MSQWGELILESGELDWRCELREGAQVLGREGSADLVLPLPVVSRQQLRLTCQADGCWAESLSETNPTYRNGQPMLGATCLEDRDLLGIGRLRLRYRAPQPGADNGAYGYLLIHQAGRADRTAPLTKSEVIIGRDSACDIVLDYPAISRRHLRLDWQATAGYRVIDLKSTHGTVVDGRPIDRPTPLQVQSRIWLGDALGNGVELIYLSPNARPPTVSPSEAETLVLDVRLTEPNSR